MKKIFTLAAAVLASLTMMAQTETVPKFTDNWAGTSISFTNAEGANGSSDQKKDGDAEKVTYVKFRTNKNGNTITLNVTDGYKVTGLYLRGYTNDGSTSVSLNSVKYDDADAITTNLEFPLSGAGTTATYENNTDVARNAIVLQMSNSGKQLMAVLRVTYSLACTDPEAVLTLSKTSMFVNEQAHLDFTTKGTSEDWGIFVMKDGDTAKYGVDYSLSSYPAMYPVSIDVTPLKAGTFELTAFQESDGTYCALEKSVTVTVSKANPVTAVTIAGPTAAYVGEAVTFTATAANASDYAWTVNGVDANTNAAEFTYTPAAAGEYSIVCSARNQFNAAEEWIASNAKVLTASAVSGVLVSYTVNSDANGAANLTGALAAKATAKVSLTKKSSNTLTVDEVEYTGFKMDKGCYAGVTLTSGSFQEGDTVSFMITTKSGTAKLYLYNDEQGTNRLDSIDFNGQTGWATFVLNQATTGVYLFRFNPDVKPYDQNPYVAALKVIRPKAVDHADVALVGVAIDGESLPSDFVTSLINEGTFTIQTSYVNAPVVAFVKHTDTYYEGETEPVSTNDSIKVTATEVEGKWQAQATIGANTYTITLAKASSFTVHYMDGTTELGTENVVANGTVAENAKYEKKSLATFVGWYTDVDLTIEAVLTAPITAETYLYAKFEEKYAESVNIEKLILDNSKDYDVKANALNGTHGYASNYNNEGMDISNDSLNDGKGAMRNYAYLGLKIKSKSLLNFRVAQGQTVLIKFGNVATTPQVSINGGEYAAMTITEGVYSYTATGDDLLSMYVSEANKAVVLKQIMIGEAPALEDVVYDITCDETTNNGTLSCNWAIALPGETVALTVTPAEGYKIAAVTVNGETVEAVEGAYSFIMPAAAAAVSATFVEDTASALGNTEAEAKAVKVVRDGQLLILKNGVLYNAQGAVVK